MAIQSKAGFIQHMSQDTWYNRGKYPTVILSLAKRNSTAWHSARLSSADDVWFTCI